MDGYDVFYTQSESVILSRFADFSAPLVFSGEKNCYHHLPESKDYFEQAGEAGFHRYLNSGLMIGYVGAIQLMLEDILGLETGLKLEFYQTKRIVGFFNDQTIYGRYVCRNPGKMIVDTNVDLFWTMTDEKFDLDRYADNMAYSPYGVLKALGEYYTRVLGGLVIKFWNVYGIERDLDKAHVITDFVLKAKNEGIINMLTDGTEERQFLYSDDACEALQILSEKYEAIHRDKELHITNGKWDTILRVAEVIASHFADVKVAPGEAKDELQKLKRNEADPYISNYWKPKTSLEEGIAKIVGFYKGNQEYGLRGYNEQSVSMWCWWFYWKPYGQAA